MSNQPQNTKTEKPGPIPADSLAADSIRDTSGSFASGQNPGISGATGSSGTFAATGGVEAFPHDERSGKGKGVYHTLGKGAPSAHQKTSTEGATGSKHSTGSTEKKGQEKSTSHGGGEVKSSSGTDMTGGWKNVGNTEMVKEEDVDWEKGNKVVTDIGGKEDPGRTAVAETVQKNVGGKVDEERSRGQFAVLEKEGDVDA